MLPGPNLVYKCPNCGNLILTESILSGNTFNAELYSDGKVISKMLPEFPRLTDCRQCNKILWLYKLEVYQKLEWPQTPKEKYNLAFPLQINDLFRALDEGVAETKDEELYIRLRIWWGYNNRIRKRVGERSIWGIREKRMEKIQEESREISVSIFDVLNDKNFLEQLNKEENSEASAEDENLMIQFKDEDDENRWKENLRQLLLLLDLSSVDNRILAAEIHRNLGNFEKSIKLLESFESSLHNKVKEQLLKECFKKNRWLIRLR